VKGGNEWELTALAGFSSPGFPQVALAKFPDWLTYQADLKWTTRECRHL
jgi:hypothetical protein